MHFIFSQLLHADPHDPTLDDLKLRVCVLPEESEALYFLPNEKTLVKSKVMGKELTAGLFS